MLNTKSNIVLPKVYKLVIFGPGGVGKSALAVQFVMGYFVSKYDPMLEDSYRKQCTVDGVPETLEIIDTAGHDESSSMGDVHVRSGDGFLLVFSLTDRSSVREMKTLYRNILRCKDRDDVPVLLVGNKADLVQDRVVTPDEVHRLCKKLAVPYYACSARTAYNVNEAFHELVRVIRARNRMQKQDPERAQDRPRIKCTYL